MDRFETQLRTGLNELGQTLASVRTYFVIYLLRRSQLFFDLHLSKERFVGGEKTEILRTVVCLVRSWLSSELMVQLVNVGFSFQLQHALKTLFEVVRTCCKHNRGVSPTIEGYDLLDYCNQVVDRCSRHRDAERIYGQHWRTICEHVQEINPHTS